ncbi:phage/plasmid replication protein, gene II/X family [Pseudomonas aeruginosa]|nr:phage/plasmid replication protein, gene II/X family [Pseudomonas aeruginosa]
MLYFCDQYPGLDGFPMLDKLHLFVPFRLEHIELLGVEGRADPVHVVDLESLGVPLQGQISRGEGGRATG